LSNFIYVGTGVNNNDIEETFTRIVRGASWKNSRTVLVMPAAQKIDTVVAISHYALIGPPNQAFIKTAAIGMEVGEAYTTAFENILDHPEMGKWEYIVTVEHDNIPPPDGLVKLIKRMEANPEYIAISGLYWQKGLDGVPQIWGDPTDPVLNFRPIRPVEGELVECNAVGMGFTLWNMQMMKDPNLRKDTNGNTIPLFKTHVGDDKLGHCTQDIWFAHAAKRCGYRFGVDCDVKVGHWDGEISW
jgi:hypothetical protein